MGVGTGEVGVLTYGAYLAGFLDENGMWSALKWVLTVFPATWGVHKVKKISKHLSQYRPNAVP